MLHSRCYNRLIYELGGWAADGEKHRLATTAVKSADNGKYEVRPSVEMEGGGNEGGRGRGNRGFSISSLARGGTANDFSVQKLSQLSELLISNSSSFKYI